MEKETEKNIDYEYHKNGKVERTIERLEDGGLITRSIQNVENLYQREKKKKTVS